MNQNKNILFVTTEAFPFAGTGSLGEILSALPKSINKQNGLKTGIMLPLYETIEFSYRQQMQFVCNIYVPVAWRNQYCGLFKLTYEDIDYYFVDNEYYFKRPNYYGYYDDAERFAYFSRAALELIPYLDFVPDIIHSNDWQTALIPVYFKLYYKDLYKDIKNVFTIHTLDYQGVYERAILEGVFGIDSKHYEILEHTNSINLMKAGIVCADFVSTVSETYAKEALTAECGMNLNGILKKYIKKFKGINGGIDEGIYNPKTNRSLFRNYDIDCLDEKLNNKIELQRMLSLPEGKNIPVIAIISRMVDSKGLDLVRQAINTIIPQNNTLNNNIQFIILGKGDLDYEGYFTHIQNMYERRIRSIIAFNNDMAQKIFSAADIYLMPSRSEPCGFSQMIACRYGTVPLVRATGGLIDSIQDCGDGAKGNGFVFAEYDAQKMTDALTRAVNLYYNNPQKWRQLQRRAMQSDFSCDNCAKEYIKIYQNL